LRPCALSRHGQARPHHLLQLFDVHQERLPAFDCAAGATYTFNTGVAKHTFCRHCGVHPFYVPRSDPDKIDVNVRCLDGIDVSTLEVQPFDGRHWEEAMQQRVPWR
jgi:hypothetical protein